MPKRTYILLSLSSKEFAKDNRGRFILFEGHPPPRIEDYPRGFNNPRKNLWSYEEVVETIVDPKHKGSPTYVMLDSQCARVTKIVGPTRQ